MEKEIVIALSKVSLEGSLSIPEKATVIVVFAHGSGSGRFSSRNQFVAKELKKNGFATLLLDLLTPEEEAVDEYSREFRFDIPLLSNRLIDVASWLSKELLTHSLKIAFFGASTGAAAALIAAANLPSTLAVVSRGGRPDLAAHYLQLVKAPTLLLVGGDDTEVIDLNEEAYALLGCEKKLTLIPGATHLFEEPGALEAVAKQSVTWFKDHQA